MKLLGMVGGTSWLSTAVYYRYINEGVNKRLGGTDFARCILFSLNLGDIIRNVDSGNLSQNGSMVVSAAKAVKAAGAEGILLCANTMHQYAEEAQAETGLPLIHIAEATRKEIQRQGLTTVGLIGTKFTMEGTFFKNILNDGQIDTLIPNDEDRQFVHDVIFEELAKEIFSDVTRARFVKIIRRLGKSGAQGIILGCTEYPLLIRTTDIDMPMFDTTKLHAQAAVDFMLND